MKVAEVAVLFEDEEVVFRVNDGFSFEALSDNVCRYFELNPLEGELVDDEDVPWPQDALVADELAKYDNQYGRVILKHLEGKLERERLEQEEYIRRLEEDESSSEEEDEEAAVQPAAAAAAAADGEPIELSGADAAAAARVEMLKGMKKSKKQLRAELVREVPYFAVFWVIFMVRAMMQATRVASVFFQTNAIRVALVEENFGDFNEKAFYDIVTYEEMFDWFENVFVPTLYPDDASPEELGTIMSYNRVVGGIRFRQVRVEPNVGCPLTALTSRMMMNGERSADGETWTPDGTIYEEQFVSECFGPYTEERESKQAYGPAVGMIAEYGSCEAVPCDIDLDEYGVCTDERTKKLCKAFTYMSAEETKEPAFGGNYGSYPASGFVRDVENKVECKEQPERTDIPLGMCTRGFEARDDMNAALESLRSNRWLDEKTRIFVIKATFYNANNNMYTSVLFKFEFTLGGLLAPSVAYGGLTQDIFDFGRDPIFTTIEAVVYAFVLYYTLVQVRVFWKTYRASKEVTLYFNDLWNVIELSNCVAFGIALFFRYNLLLPSLYPNEMIFEPYYVDYQNQADLYATSFRIEAVNILALFLKMFKYFQLNPDTNMLWSVLTAAGKDIGYFMFMLGIFILAFSFMATQMFGTTLIEYRSEPESMISLTLLLLGQIDLEGMQQANPDFGTLFFLVYMVVMFLILMNIFLAILGEAYSLVRERAMKEKERQLKLKKGPGPIAKCRGYFKAKRERRRAAKAAKKGEVAPKLVETPVGLQLASSSEALVPDTGGQLLGEGDLLRRPLS